MTKSPEISYSADYVHTFPLDSAGEIDVRVNVSYTDERWLSANFLAEQRVDDYTIWNAYVSYRSADTRPFDYRLPGKRDRRRVLSCVVESHSGSSG